MNLVRTATLIAAVTIFTASPVAAKKSKKKKLFDFESDNVRCLVCQAVSDEFLIAINKVDPKKKTEGMSTFRLDGNGNQKKNVITYARSQEHLMTLTEDLCENFEDYVQARWKEGAHAGEPTVLRMTDGNGEMNPNFPKVEMHEINENHSGILKYHCRSVVEDQEDHFMELLPDKENDLRLRQEVCVNRSKLCKEVEEREMRYFERPEVPDILKSDHEEL